MNKLTRQLKTIQSSGRPGYMMHIVAGYPDLGGSRQVAKTILNTGADFLEIQIPFSDPVADGPVIASANETALANGVTVRSSLDLIEEITGSTEKPIIIMSYFNIIHRYGVEAFCKKARSIGVQGLIIPDYPYDEDDGDELIRHCQDNQLAFIQVLASTTTNERMAQISRTASGFLYCMARTGITGKTTTINEETKAYLQNVKNHSSLPLAVGFGISGNDQVKALQPYAEIMVVGSALINTYTNKPLGTGLVAVKKFIKNLLD